MRMYRLKDKEANLCDICRNDFANCFALKPEFGNGLGNDNVIACACYSPPPYTMFPIDEVEMGEVVDRTIHEERH